MSKNIASNLFCPILIAACLSGTPTLAAERTDVFPTIFAAELANRSNARAALALLQEQSGEPLRQDFWKRYLELEEVTLDIYKPHAAASNLEASHASWVISAKARIASIFHWLCKDCFVSTLSGRTEKYLTTLKEADGDIAGSKAELYAYIVAQETAQVDALRLAARQDFSAGTNLLRNFAQCARLHRERAATPGQCGAMQ